MFFRSGKQTLHAPTGASSTMRKTEVMDLSYKDCRGVCIENFLLRAAAPQLHSAACRHTGHSPLSCRHDPVHARQERWLNEQRREHT